MPYECLTRPGLCPADSHDHTPMAGDPCAAAGCHQLLAAGSWCYAVRELPALWAPPAGRVAQRPRWRQQWVCGAHVNADAGGLRRL